MKIIADLSREELVVDTARFHITCKVRTIRDGTRASYEVVRTLPDNLPYDPHTFPKGIWNITGIDWQREKGFDRNTYGPVKIRTDASHTVNVWALDDNGDYFKETSDLTVDIGYLLHYSASSTTLGCIRLDSPKNAEEIASFIQQMFDRKESIQLEVIGG